MNVGKHQKFINKNVRYIAEHSMTFSIYHNGKRIKITDKSRRFLQHLIDAQLKPGYKCVIEYYKPDAVAFKQGKKPKKFGPEMVQKIKEDTNSIAYKQEHYGASESVIRKIMNDRY